MLTAIRSLGLFLLVLLVLGNKVVTLASLVALMHAKGVVALLLLYSLVAVVTMQTPVMVTNAGVTGAVVDLWLLPLGPKTNLTF
jgi:hypothetical protein